MPIRPIDLISIAPRSQEASQQHVSEQNRLQHAHDSAAIQFGEHIKEESESVVRMVKGEKAKYQYDAKEKGKGQKKSSKKKKKQDNKGKNNAEQRENFDIKI